MGNLCCKNNKSEEIHDVNNELQTDTIPFNTETIIQLNAPKTSATITLQRNRNRNITEGNNTYTTNGRKRCATLIINNESALRGAAIDSKSLRRLFKALGGQQQCKCDLDRKTMTKTMHNFARHACLKQCDVFVMVVLAPVQLSGDKIVAVAARDTQFVALSDIVGYFNDAACPSLIGKPKIFIFQGPQATVNGHLIASDLSKANLRDVFIANALLTGPMEKREIGSFYVQALCKVFEMFACSRDLENLIKMVDEIVYKNDRTCQHTYYETYGFNKLCFFNPL